MAREQIRVIKTADGGERLQQKAGPKSSLGRIKFDFDNRYGVYLHDTPSRGAFDDGRRRNVSHGCVRLENPNGLALALLQGQGVWSQEKIAQTIAGGATQRVELGRQTAVFLLYWTAVAGADGRMYFYRDPYDWDHELLQKLSPSGQGDA
jgi:murein L,D-transpeptidase YcbB/YkuD